MCGTRQLNIPRPGTLGTWHDDESRRESGLRQSRKVKVVLGSSPAKV
jgi:hypothetical protein